jgi:hypothetical protein
VERVPTDDTSSPAPSMVLSVVPEIGGVLTLGVPNC